MDEECEANTDEVSGDGGDDAEQISGIVGLIKLRVVWLYVVPLDFFVGRVPRPSLAVPKAVTMALERIGVPAAAWRPGFHARSVRVPRGLSVRLTRLAAAPDVAT